MVVETPEDRIVTQPADDDAMNAVRILLEQHRGAREAISSRQIALVCGMSRRKVRAIIQYLVVRERMLIGALVDGQKGGYFMIETWDELAAVRMILSSRLGEIAARDRALVKAWARQHGQVIQPLLPWDDLQVECQV